MAQRSGGRVARIGKDFAARRQLGCVEACEILVTKVDLAAHVDRVRYVFALAFECVRNFLDGLDIGGDVFAFGAVAARCRVDQFAALVSDRDREPVDLRLGGEREWRCRGDAKEPAYARVKVVDIAVVECIAERQHRDVVADFAKRLVRLSADPIGGTLGWHDIGKTVHNLVVSPAQCIIGGIGNVRRIVAMV